MDEYQSIFLITLGAVLGANLRFIVISQYKFFYLQKHILTSIINIISSFLLGFLVSFGPSMENIRLYNQIFLFCGVGFLGAFSSFSTFIFDLFSLLKNHQYQRFISLLLLSTSLSLMASYVGYFVGNL